MPAFRKPKSKNAATTLAAAWAASRSRCSLGLTALALDHRGAATPRTREHLDRLRRRRDAAAAVIAQVAAAVFGDDSRPVLLHPGRDRRLILLLAANTAFNGFPLLGSILAQDGYLPRQLHTRGDRLVFSNGIIVLAVVAGLLVVVFDADVTQLIQLYIIGVFMSFTLGQTGMVRHWTRAAARPSTSPQRARGMQRSAGHQRCRAAC